MPERIIGIFNSHDEADKALKLLMQAGFPSRSVAILGKNEERSVAQEEDHINQEMTKGGMIGGVTGLLLDAETFLMRGVSDHAASGITTGLNYNPIGGSAAGSLTDVGLRNRQKERMTALIEQGKHLVCLPADGDTADIARSVIRQAGGRLDTF